MYSDNGVTYTRMFMSLPLYNIFKEGFSFIFQVDVKRSLHLWLENKKLCCCIFIDVLYDFVDVRFRFSNMNHIVDTYCIEFR